MLLAAVVVVCFASHSLALPADHPLPFPVKAYYDVEDAENLFKEHIVRYQRSYDVKEYSKRLNIFKDTLKTINDLNTEYAQGGFHLTQFADLTDDEKNNYFGFVPDSDAIKEKNKEILLSYIETAPPAFDWRAAGKVTPVKDQGGCPTCYIFSVIGNIEGQYAIKNNQCIALSEQQCMDCLPGMGCKAGDPLEVYSGLAQRKGSMKEEEYPYVDKEEAECKEKAGHMLAKISGGKLMNVDEELLKQRLFEIGPLSIALDGSDMVYYNGGILHPKRCSSKPEALNHAMTLVGYGEEKGEKYWILKGSFGVKQGEKGYIRILRGVNACGITNYVSTAHLA